MESLIENTELDLLAIIDIGSNSIKTSVYLVDGQKYSIIFKDKCQTGFSKGLMYSGNIDKSAIKKSLEYLYSLKTLLQSFNAIKLKAIASSAMRVADNAKDFLSPAEKILKTKIQVISEHQEAELAVAGVELEVQKVNGLVLDLGGGSLEFASVKNKKILQLDSCLLGHQIMADYAEQGLDKLEKYIKDTLSELQILQKQKIKNLYLTGGKFRKLARYHLRITQGEIYDFRAYKLDFEEVKELTKFKSKSIMNVKRESLLLYYSTILLHNILYFVPADNIYFCRNSIREGLLAKTYLQ